MSASQGRAGRELPRRRHRARRGGGRDARPRAGRDRHARRPGPHRGRAARAQARPGRGEARRAARGHPVRRRDRAQRPARRPHPPSRGDGEPGRGPRGQAQDARPVPRRRSRGWPATWGSLSRAGRSWMAAGAAGDGGGAAYDASSTGVSRIVLGAQEDLRREIARAMHDGPAQSLTNIVLQAQIVERLLVARPGGRPGRGPPARVDGPADARRDEVVHLRRPADGPRRPRPRADAAARARGSAASGRASRSSSTRWGRTGASRWSSRAGSSASSTRR